MNGITEMSVLTLGERAKIYDISRESDLRRRFFDIGLTKDSEIECVGISPMGDGVIHSYMPDLSTPGAVKTGEVELVAGVALKSTSKAAVLKGITIGA